jgi:glutaredoxin
MNTALSKVFLLISLLFSLQVSAAVKIVECEDESGNRSFQKTCPPGTTQVSEKQFRTGSKNNESQQSSIEAILYLIPDCETCEQVKEFLAARDIPVTEKNVNDNIELQNELTSLTGSLKVPTTIIGDETLTGYSRSSFMEALERAGYEEES